MRNKDQVFLFIKWALKIEADETNSKIGFSHVLAVILYTIKVERNNRERENTNTTC